MAKDDFRKRRKKSDSSMEQNSRRKRGKEGRGKSPFASSDDDRNEGERTKRKTIRSRYSSYESEEGERKITTSHEKSRGYKKSKRINQGKKSSHSSDEYYTSSSVASSPRREISTSEGRKKEKMDHSKSGEEYSSVDSEDKSSQGGSPSTPSLSSGRTSVSIGRGCSTKKGRNKSKSASSENSDECWTHAKRRRLIRDGDGGAKRVMRAKHKHKSGDDENQGKELERKKMKKGNRKRERHHSSSSGDSNSNSNSTSTSGRSEVKKRIRPNEGRSDKRENRRSEPASSEDTDVGRKMSKRGETKNSGRNKKRDGKDHMSHARKERQDDRNPKRGKRRKDERSESSSLGSVRGGESEDSSPRQRKRDASAGSDKSRESRHSGDGTSSSGGSSNRRRRRRGKGTSSSDNSESSGSSESGDRRSDEGKKRKKGTKPGRRKSREEEKQHQTEEAYDPYAEDQNGNLEINEELIEYAKQKIANVTTEDIGKAGGVYIPPFKLERLKKEVTNKKSALYQKQEWLKLKKKINNIVNKVNVDNIGDVCYELFECNLIRGKGIFSRALIHAQLSSPAFTHVFAALLCIINSKFPTIGLLTIQRIILHFRRSYKRNDKIVCMNSVKFIAHMINQRVIHEIVGLQLCSILLQNITNDSVQVCTYFLAEVGELYMNICRKGIDIIFDRLKDIIQEGKINIKTQYDIEKLWTYRKNYFRDFPTILEDLDLIDEDEKIVHEIDLLDESFENQEELNIFREVTPEQYEEENIEWENIANELLHGDASGGRRKGRNASDQSDECDQRDESDRSDEIDGASAGSDESSTDSENDHPQAREHSDISDGKSGRDDEEEEDDDQAKQEITDMTEQYLINLRKNVYLSIMSSLSFEECVHKLLKLNIKKGYEIEICNMLIDCCCMEKTFQKFYALQAERLCKLKIIYQENFQKCFQNSYNTAHRLETAKLRNCAKLFAHLLYTDSVSWSIFLNIKLSEEDTTSSTRIFLKILLQELTNNLGMQAFYHKINHPAISPFMSGLFPTDNAQDIRFCVNFFTAIGLGALTTSMRKLLQG
ncbi:cell cycle control protein, putative [Plasmodium knowlesi strain H]|uniref:Cell cycle control protein, putative n=3 Tax=Plasmodium knowlesi TaxID=5850 RepID=A0A5K1U3W8_PLAKH|nr:pre-mRNA-splicing factor CWC22, putative [Plasmodium knowlesi strain H]OTN63734.1 putative Cell cycle control protein [Plasmodium knowlesi]CAA9991178.1 pre-mRNA-splicing factor CWC22, putative [Plasmodium knowlesi strain H]SBO27151.1 cell cycle control protein, putative [Plasmodium knowlesi strain H]SBO29385.1 cell cycle control protein, putative [Plasmodium knowlesi strain H]VVS80652.1 pre-mRNA-splicing factor CWC22, putative [Plasmodium knowlesi strain H]|eukprot:XP_002262470.1 cell cycle control protein, putative [Plasmodium knowlesi strain H]